MDFHLQEILMGRRRSESLRTPLKLSPLDQPLSKSLMVETDETEVHPFLTNQLHEEFAQLKLPELSSYIFPAFKALLNEKHAYLEVAANRHLQNCFAQAAGMLSKLDPDKLDSKELSELLNISENDAESMLKIARAKFDEGLYPACISIFVLLVSLNPNNWDYWFRLGIAAQEGNDFDLALRSYEATIALNPDHLDAYLFSSECFRNQGDTIQAKERLVAAERLVSSADVESRQLYLVLKKTLK